MSALCNPNATSCETGPMPGGDKRPKSGQVDNKLGDLSKAVSNLRDIIDALVERLSPVLFSDADQQETGYPTEPLCHIGVRINESEHVVLEQINKLNIVINSLQI